MSQKAGTCECGLNIRKADGKAYWIEYRIDGRRKRERIGTSKLAAETRLQTVLNSRAEDRYSDRNKNTCWTLGELAPWYLALPEVQAKLSHDRDEHSIRHLLRHVEGGTRISALTHGMLEGYQRKRLGEASVRRLGKNDDSG